LSATLQFLWHSHEEMSNLCIFGFSIYAAVILQHYLEVTMLIDNAI